MRSPILVAVALLACCAHAEKVGPGKDVSLFECVDDGVGPVLEHATIIWPDVAPVVHRLDVFCVEADHIDDYGVCGRSPAKSIEGCAAWPGSRMAHARIYVSKAKSARRVVAHEIQHLRPEVWKHPDGCTHHTPDCWNAAKEAELKAGMPVEPPN